MKRGSYLFTSESVTEGHPDKLCDQVSDAVLDAILSGDPNARVACETAVTTGMLLVMGELRTDYSVNIADIARKTIAEIGYTRAKYGFDAESCAVLTSLGRQSPDIAQGVDRALEDRHEGSGDTGFGAGDQGLMFGYATDETEELMPLPISLAHQLARQLASARKQGTLNYLRPDGKTQVSVQYKDNKPQRIDTVLVSTQHEPDVSLRQIEADLLEAVIRPILPQYLVDKETKYLVNPTGRFVIGGPNGDAGLTGRKIIVDTYGGMSRHGGGAFSGKDPTKVDRSAAYASRYVAKNLVAAGLAKRVELQVAYAIGVANPVSISVDTFGTGVIADHALLQLVREYFDLRPAAIIRDLDLLRPIYKNVASYGHFGRLDLDLPWERTDKAEILRKSAEKLVLAN